MPRLQFFGGRAIVTGMERTAGVRWGWPLGALAAAAALVAAFLSPAAAGAEVREGPLGGIDLESACGSCHASAVAAYRETLHGRLFRDRPRGARELDNCAACHGPLDAHAADPDDPASIRSLRRARNPDPRARSAPCLDCHAAGPLADGPHGRHLKAGVACGDCHVVMRPVSTRALLTAQTAFDLCASCHPGVAAQRAARTTHVSAGAGLSCTDCHNPHARGRGALKAASVNETCAPCHRTQSGPFLFEHPPVEESCLNCHAPHGAPQPALLKMNAASLCLSCHSQAPFFHSFTGMDRFTLGRSCANCHSQIHGSNHATGGRLQR